jgi:hypothetical protein
MIIKRMVDLWQIRQTGRQIAKRDDLTDIYRAIQELSVGSPYNTSSEIRDNPGVISKSKFNLGRVGKN